VQTIIPYAGAKSRLAAELVKLFPPHQWFVSVCGGLATEFAHKPPTKKEVFNDIDEHVWSVWRCLQDEKKYDELIHRLAEKNIRTKEAAAKQEAVHRGCVDELR